MTYYVGRGYEIIENFHYMKDAKDFCVKYLKAHPKGKLQIFEQNQMFVIYNVRRFDNTVEFSNRNGGGEIVVIRKKRKSATNGFGLPMADGNWPDVK